MDISKRIIELREKKGWTQYRLYKEAKIGQSTLSQIESGARYPNTATLQKIASALGVSMAEFDDKFMDDLRHDVLNTMRDMLWNAEEKEAVEKIKKMPLNEQQQSFLKTYEKFKRLSNEEQEALSKIIDSLSSQK